MFDCHLAGRRSRKDQWYNSLMTMPPDKIDELIQAIRALQESLEKTDTSRDEEVRTLGEYVNAIRDRVERQDKIVQTIAAAHDAEAEVINVLGEWNENLTSRMDGINTKVDGIRDDIGLVRGGHARNAMRQNLPRIADEFGFQFISEMPQAAVIGFSKVATAQGEAAGEAESFRNADTVISVLTDTGQPGYVAIEASFTVESNDVRRAARNADYLAGYTGLSTFAVVAGVNVLPEAQEEIDAGKALLYRIPARDLQSE